MSRTIALFAFRCLVAAAVWSMFLASAAFAQRTPATKRLDPIQKALMTPVDVPDEFRQPVPLKLVFLYLRDQLAAKGMPLPIWVDQYAFKIADPEVPELLESTIVFTQEFLTGRTLAEVMNETARQMGGDAVVWRRAGHLEITTRKSARNTHALENRIDLEANGITLREAIDEIAAELGVTIQIDPRCEPAMKKTVHVSAHNQTTARGLITMWADAYGLVLLADDERVLLMPRPVYVSKLRDELTEARLLADIVRSRRIQIEIHAANAPPLPAAPKAPPAEEPKAEPQR